MKLHEINDSIREIEKRNLDISLDIEQCKSNTDAIELKYLIAIAFDPNYKNEKQRDIKLKEMLAEDKEYTKWDSLLMIAKKEYEQNKIEIGFYKRLWETEKLLFVSHNCYDLPE
ncbi:MAG: hypothetical protein RBT64_13955 [Trichloromonas sp.]|jgi:hypothetical protein|nr:hypothetical protein [Trichloromonas sp.]